VDSTSTALVNKQLIPQAINIILCSRENDADLRQKDTGKITPVSYVP
jgi:hypothetical protein